MTVGQAKQLLLLAVPELLNARTDLQAVADGRIAVVQGKLTIVRGGVLDSKDLRAAIAMATTIRDESIPALQAELNALRNRISKVLG
ncbi:MAG: hypothetical protein V4515_14555 [Chloroflexota bacterium]